MTTPENETMIQSRLLAKAVVRQGDTFQIIALFERAHEYKFAMVFSARTPRSPRKCWKPKGYHILQEARKFDPRGRDNSASFEQLLSNCYRGWEHKIRYVAKRRHVKTFIDRLSNHIHNLPAPVAIPGLTYERANRITSGRKRLGRY